MKKLESKYVTAAVKMDEAFLALLEMKDFSCITVKEICEKAGVHRSTFYLHYETLADLLSESLKHRNNQFLAYMNQNTPTFLSRLKDCPPEDLYLITPQYLTPYLNYIKEHQRLFRTAMENSAVLGMNKSFEGMFRHVFSPVLDRFGVPPEDKAYMMSFYMKGLMGIVSQWLKYDCADDPEHVISVIEKCVPLNPSEQSKLINP